MVLPHSHNSSAHPFSQTHKYLKDALFERYMKYWGMAGVFAFGLALSLWDWNLMAIAITIFGIGVCVVTGVRRYLKDGPPIIAFCREFFLEQNYGIDELHAIEIMSRTQKQSRTVRLIREAAISHRAFLQPDHSTDPSQAGNQ